MMTKPNPTPQQSPPSALLQTGKFPIPRRLDELYNLDARIAELQKTNGAHDDLANLLSRRARCRLEFGFSQLAIQDLTDVQALHAAAARGGASAAASHFDDARLAEALRVDARDRLLSKTNAAELFAAVERSVHLFRLALQKLAATKAPDRKHEAWMHAHLAGAQTMNFWITISERPNDAINGLGDDTFRDAEEHFLRALELEPEYAWAHRFRAHLHALRGNEGDFAIAITCLEAANAIEQKVAARNAAAQGAGTNQDAVGAAASSGAEEQQSSFQRSLAMLFSYVAVQSDSAEAAHQSIAAGLLALARDPDELHAPHSIVASLFWLAHHGPEADRAKHATYLKPAIETAFHHARNAASRASGVLASLALMEALQSDGDVVEAAAKAKRVLDGFLQMGIRADLETRAFSYRTPSVALLKKKLAAPVPTNDPRTELLLTTFKPIIDSLTTQLAIPNPNKAHGANVPPARI